MRGGPGLGTIQPGQGDYYQATRGGGNGDYRTLVLSPSNVQEAVDFVQEAFDIADQYRNPVMVVMGRPDWPDDGAHRVASCPQAGPAPQGLGHHRP